MERYRVLKNLTELSLEDFSSEHPGPEPLRPDPARPRTLSNLRPQLLSCRF